MTFLESFELRLISKTGLDCAPYFEINGFQCSFEQVQGQLDAGETWSGWGFPSSVPHRLLLFGNDRQNWQIETLELRFHCRGLAPFERQFHQVEIKPGQGFSIWADPASGAFEV